MKLDSVFIRGFKSFAYPTKIDVSSGVTAVVGPNGSGKSNVVDSIRWLFGEQSMKALRADSREDVLFVGSDNHPPSNTAEVKLVFQDENGKFSVSRVLTREGNSEYRMNSKSVRLKDIKELFKGTGVGMDLYSIVGQGQVDQVVSASPYELRKLIEEAAGTAVYRERKREAMSKLTATQANLDRVRDILFELEKQRKSLYLKAKRAEKYLEYSDNRKKLKRLYFGNVLRIETDTLNKYNEDKKELEKELQKIQKELIEKESRWSTLRQEFSEMDKEIENFTQLLEEYKQRQSDLLDFKEMYSRRLGEKESKLVESTTKTDSLKEDIENLEKRKEEVAMIKDNMDEKINKKKNELEELENKREEIVKEHSEKEKKWLKQQEELESINKKISKATNEIDRLTNNQEDISKRLEMITSQLKSKRERFNELKEEIEKLASKGKKSSEKQEETEENISSVKEKIKSLEEQFEKLDEERQKMKDELRSSEMEMSTLTKQLDEYQGFSRSVREIFERKDKFSGLMDVVANIIEVPPKYETAISVLLGGRMQDVVVKDSFTAKRIIEYLKGSKTGRITLLPLDMLEGKFSEYEPAEKHKGFVGYAAKLVNVPDDLDVVPRYLFRNSIIVNNLDDAIDIRKNANFYGRLVSLDGQLLSTGGAITGGYISDDVRSDLISRKRRIKYLKDRKEQLKKSLKMKEKEIQRNKDDLKELKGYLKVLQEELNEIVSNGAAINRMIHELIKSADEVEDEVTELEQLEEDYTYKLNNSEKRKKELSEELDVLKKDQESIKGALEDVSEELKSKRTEMEEMQSELVDRKLELSTLQEKTDQYNRELEDIKKKKEQNKQKIMEMKKLTEETEEDIKRVKKQISDIENELSSLKKETTSLFSNIKYHREGKEEHLDRLQKIEDEINELKDQREESRNKIHQLDMSIQESNMKLENVNKELEELENVDEVPVLSEDELKEKKNELDDIEKKLKFLGTVDLDTIDEYKVVDNDYQELDKERKDLEEAKEKLNDLIEKTDKEAKKIFLETFEKINEYFSQYISELFEGGEGEIKLFPGEDILETGVEIAIRKPGRKFQKLQLFSGGEKALVGIALVFSLLTIKPSPFYILDEVDAPLDDFNAERFKKMLDRHAEETQFLVITHNKLVMEVADVLHGITMMDGLSKVIPVELSSIETVVG